MLSYPGASALVLQDCEGWKKTQSSLGTLSEVAQQESQ